MAESSGDASTTLTGSQVGRFRIAESIGGGGMGMVYRAHDEALGRDVALKFIQPHLTSDEKVASRFRQEARVIASLEHPNICSVDNSQPA